MSYNAQVVLLTAILLLTFRAAVGTEFLVGGASGWTLPNDQNGLNYTALVNTTNLVVGDSLVFKYNPSSHNVLSVTGPAFAQCTTSEPLGEWKDGNTTITFEKEGRWWFICGTPGHCSSGQAFRVTVTAAPGLASPPSPPQLGAANTLIRSSKAVVILLSMIVGVSLL